MADAIHAAFGMDKEECRRRMRRLIHKNDMFWRVDSFLSAAIAKDPGLPPPPKHYAGGRYPLHPPYNPRPWLIISEAIPAMAVAAPLR